MWKEWSHAADTEWATLVSRECLINFLNYNIKINFNPIFNLARCFACHFGPNIFQQCLHCQYLITWHSQPTNWNTTMNHTMNKIPFKDSFIGMFKDIEEKLESDNDHFSQTTIISFFQDTSEILTMKSHAGIAVLIRKLLPLLTTPRQYLCS